MELTTSELNELVYSLNKVIIEDSNDSWNTELRKELFNKIYAELEDRVSVMEI